MFTMSVGCHPPTERAADLQRVTEAFYNFQNAVVDENGAKAVTLVTQGTLDRYAVFRHWALHDTQQQLAERKLLEKIAVLELRHLFSADDLLAWTGREVLEELINRGRLNSNLIVNARVGEPVFQDGTCYLRAYDGAQVTKNRYTFFNEDGVWKIDLPSLEGLQENIFEAMVREQNRTEQEILSNVIEEWTAEDPAKDLREPLVRAGPAENSDTSATLEQAISSPD